ncbi:hypothetical protein D3C71_1031490 [compost metagenome]
MFDFGLIARLPVAHVDLFHTAAHGYDHRRYRALEALVRTAKHQIAGGLIGQTQILQRLAAHAVGGKRGLQFFHADSELNRRRHAAALIVEGLLRQLRQGQAWHFAGQAHAVDKRDAVGQNLRNH